MHIGLNAHLLASGAGYRTAGIHGYIDGLLRCLPAAAPTDWQFTVLVGRQCSAAYPGLALRRSRLDTSSPLVRILWEQLIQPAGLSPFDLYHGLAFVAPLWLRRPSVVTVYDLSFVHHPDRLPRLRRWYLRALSRLSCRRARRVIAISHSTAHDISTTFGIAPELVDVAPPGFAAQTFRPLLPELVAKFRQAKGLPERFWLFIGTLEPRKNLLMLLEAYAGLSFASRLPLIIGGAKGWGYAPIFEAVERLGLGDSVHFAGFISSDELPFWYNSAEVFVYPSIFEGFGLPVLEAMACGLPVLVSNTSSLPEVAGSAGLCLPPHDPAAWREALRRAAEDVQWRRAAREAGLVQAQRFTWVETAKQTILSYQRALQ
ncbi:MAG: glycosyltransferase family 1 protein [Aggregatilineales bacterium]